MPYDEAKEDGKRCEGKDAKDDDDDDFEDAIERRGRADASRA